MISIYEQFVKNYNDPNLTGEDIKRVNGLNSKKYCRLRAKAIKNGDITTPRHMNSTTAKFYTKTKNGDYIVKKQYANKTVLVGRFADEKTAQMIVKHCKNVNWDLNKVSNIIEQYKVQPKNYTCTNGYYVVQKVVSGKRVIFCRLKKESEAKIMVNELRKCHWDENKVEKILQKIREKEQILC